MGLCYDQFADCWYNFASSLGISLGFPYARLLCLFPSMSTFTASPATHVLQPFNASILERARSLNLEIVFKMIESCFCPTTFGSTTCWLWCTNKAYGCRTHKGADWFYATVRCRLRHYTKLPWREIKTKNGLQALTKAKQRKEASAKSVRPARPLQLLFSQQGLYNARPPRPQIILGCRPS